MIFRRATMTFTPNLNEMNKGPYFLLPSAESNHIFYDYLLIVQDMVYISI